LKALGWTAKLGGLIIGVCDWSESITVRRYATSITGSPACWRQCFPQCKTPDYMVVTKRRNFDCMIKIASVTEFHLAILNLLNEEKP
jgi:hypothetical protein